MRSRLIALNATGDGDGAVRNADGLARGWPARAMEVGSTQAWPHLVMRASKTGERFVHHQAALDLRDGGGLTIAAVADTHGRPHPESARHIAATRPDAILHAGDIGDLGVLADLAKIAPVVAVRGNIDARADDLPDAITIDIRSAGESVMRILLLHIAVSGPRLRADAARLAKASSAGVVVCGHSHVPFAGRDRGLVVYNPGSIGPRRFHLPIVFGVLEIAANEMKVRHIDCETGRPWVPPCGTLSQSASSGR